MIRNHNADRACNPAAGARTGSHGAVARLLHVLAAYTLVAIASIGTATAQERERPEQHFVELTCDASGTAKLRTLSPGEVEPAWRDPAIADNAPISLKRHIMRIHDRRIFKGGASDVPVWATGSFAHRMTRCRAGKSEIVARIAENWGYNDQVDGYLRLWIDKHPLNLSILSLQQMTAELDITAQKISACINEIRIFDVDDPDKPPKRLCSSNRFELRAPDAIEFAPANLVKGPNQNLVLLETNDRGLCRDIGPHLDGGPLPTGYARPPTAKAPETWDYANSAKAYRVDADNDGEIDDVAILEVDQHVYTGSLLAMFEKDTVFKGKIPPPWWADLLQASLSQNMRGGIEPKALPKEFNWVTNAHDIGGYEAGSLDMFVHAGTSYVVVQEFRSMHHHEEYLVEPGEPAAIGTIPADNFEQLVVKLTADESAETVCRFVYREEVPR